MAEDPEFSTLAMEHDAHIYDVRNPGKIDRIAKGLARKTRARRVLTVGTDCAIGKMVTSLELRKAAVEAGLDAAFVATGQTGIMIEGWGISIDHVISDFTAGAVEMLVEHVGDRQICFVEGQGSIEHPGYSGVTCSLLHGSCPEVMVMCHRPDRELHGGWEDCPVAPITQQIELYEKLLAPLIESKVVAVAVNTYRMDPSEADAMVKEIARTTGLPAADPIRQGCGELLQAVRSYLGI
jgi:uncharacterized NAD-dependent epimerase/dehydratase family protein